MKATHDDIVTLLTFYRGLGRPLTLFEIHRLLPSPDDIMLHELELLLAELSEKRTIRAEDGFYTLQEAECTSIARRMQDLVVDLKWKRFLKKARWLRIIPFLEFAVASGSMAFGNATASSDFDLLVSVRPGKMFTARYSINFLFSLLGARRLSDLHDGDANKLCFNHFVTESTYAKSPHNLYRQQLHKNIIPLMGSRRLISKFLKANEWSGVSETIEWDRRFSESKTYPIKRLLEIFFTPYFWERSIFRPIAMRRLVRYVKTKPQDGRVIVGDRELEFHFDISDEKRFGKIPTRWQLT